MKKILLIEDDPPTRKLTSRVLRFADFEVIEAANGKQGVAAALDSVPDLILCDIMMPELDGLGVLSALRENPRTALIPFIFLTAKIQQNDQRQGMEEGADDYITKPYNVRGLVASVKRRLQKRERQIEESRRNSEELSLAVAASIPEEIMEALDHLSALTNVLALKYSAHDPQVAATHQTILRESSRLRRMMRRLHVYSQLPQLYARRFELSNAGATASPDAIIERVAREVFRKWKREPDLKVALDQTALPVGEEYLEMIVEELVDNACKFSAHGTIVTLESRGRREFWSLEVRNLGEGMSPDQIAQIGGFKQFWQGGERPKGLGLGLALTQGIARLHGAEFSIQSDNGVTTASILIPLAI